MRPSGHDTSRLSAAFLLTAFLAGGLLGPALHRAHHGLLWAKLHADAAQTCDHSLHGDGYENVAPAFFEDQCPLCFRQVFHFDGPETSPTAYQDFSGYAPHRQQAPETPLLSLPSIRGPPRPA